MRRSASTTRCGSNPRWAGHDGDDDRPRPRRRGRPGTSATADGDSGEMTGDELTILAVDDERTQLEDLARLLHNSRASRGGCACDRDDALVKARPRLRREPPRRPHAHLDGLELGRVLRRFADPRSWCSSRPTKRGRDAFESTHWTTCASRWAGGAWRRRSSASRRRWSRRGCKRRANGAVAAPGRRRGGWGGLGREMIAVANLHGGSTRLLARREISTPVLRGFVRIVTGDGRDPRGHAGRST